MQSYLFIKQVMLVFFFLFLSLAACGPEPETAVSPTAPPAEATLMSTATTTPSAVIAEASPLPATATESIVLPTAPATRPTATADAEEATTTPQPTTQQTMPLPLREDITFTLAAQLGGTVNAVALDGHIVYAGIGPRLVTVDISDPVAPRFLGQSDVLSGVVHAVAVQAGVAYVAAGGDLHLFDVSDPARLVKISSIALTGEELQKTNDGRPRKLVDVVLNGNIVYTLYRVYNGHSEVMVVDITNLAQPVLVGRRSVLDNAAIAAGEDVLYIFDKGRLNLVDAANLDFLSAIGSGVNGGGYYFVTVLNDIAYVIQNGVFRVFDVSDPAQPIAVVASMIDIRYSGEVTAPEATDKASLMEMTATEEALFLVGRPGSQLGCPEFLHVIDITDAAAPRQAAEFNPQSCINDIAVAGDTLVAAASNKLQIFDVSDPANLALAGEFVHPAGFSYVGAIALNQDVAYINSGDPFPDEPTLLRVLDLTQPAAPRLTSDVLDLSSQYGMGAAGLYVRGNRLFHPIQHGNYTIAIDISRPTSPRRVEGLFYGPAVPALMGDTLYTATADGQGLDIITADGQGLGIIDMSDPANLVLANTISTEGYEVREMSASDRYLIVISQKATATTQAGTTFSKRLQIYDVSDPFQPAEVGRVEPVGDAFGFTLVGDTIYAIASDTSYENFYLVVLDISDPAHPVEVGRFVLPFYITEIVPAGDTLYLSTDDGIWALNVSDKTQPYLAGHLPFGSSLSIVGDLLYIAAGDTGLYIVSAPTSGSCVNDSAFVLDVNVPDGTHVAPGVSFTKTWRLRNSGTCTWDASYRFDFISGERMDGPQNMALGQTVLPGAEVDISIELMAPQSDGTYQGQWQLVAPDATPFGAKPYVEVVVP